MGFYMHNDVVSILACRHMVTLEHVTCLTHVHIVGLRDLVKHPIKGIG